MMGLMDGAIEAETHQAQGADQQSIKLIEAAVSSEKLVGCLMQADESAMHQVAGHQHERHRQPDQSAMHDEREQHFRENQTDDEKLKRASQYPVRLMQLAEVFVDGAFHWG